MAAKTSSLPSPQTLLFAAVPPQLVSDVSTAVCDSSASVVAMSPISEGAADQSSATEPERWGEAIEVPLKLA